MLTVFILKLFYELNAIQIFKQIDKLVKVTTDEVEAAQGDFCQSLEIME
ncbi:hypothetical protein [Enterococcus pseudoavium]|nr:hypothetical protein [Enterococcus pseudoavium]